MDWTLSAFTLTELPLNDADTVPIVGSSAACLVPVPIVYVFATAPSVASPPMPLPLSSRRGVCFQCSESMFALPAI
ncbi:hypothetical protein MBAV_004410 [Candidatus Magnetobacterium bavaricum]|uniref:Uncharacterized protein n=1 Tax=Candidatus Magnetobacterium bavaricum TaxID=29290 RepID=A0A0F3GN92_9BACT|nr:hypothetical protein MBAV_004410 [Candidatus Magnetobacterium bavaricum]